MQFIRVLGGCLSSYFLGVAIFWASYLYALSQGQLHVFDQWSSLKISLVYGAIFATPVTLIVIVVWLVLAWGNKTVHLSAALIAGGATGAFLFGVISLNPLVAVIGILVGLLFGATFWVTAFGLRRSALLTFRSDLKSL